MFANDIFSLSWIANGAYEALYIPVPYPKWWDIAAGILFVKEAGGIVTTAKGTEFNQYNYLKDGLLASNGNIHNKLLELINKT